MKIRIEIFVYLKSFRKICNKIYTFNFVNSMQSDILWWNRQNIWSGNTKSTECTTLNMSSELHSTWWKFRWYSSSEYKKIGNFKLFFMRVIWRIFAECACVWLSVILIDVLEIFHFHFSVLYIKSVYFATLVEPFIHMDRLMFLLMWINIFSIFSLTA